MINVVIAAHPITREAKGRTSDGHVTPEKTLARQAEYDALCAQYPEGIVRVAKLLYAKDHLFGSERDKALVFDPIWGMMKTYLDDATRLIAIFNGEPVSAPFEVHEVRWVAEGAVAA